MSELKTTVDSISADGVGTADTAGIKRDTTGTTTTSIETNTKISSSGITTNKATVSGATATTLENGKLTVGAATVQNTGFAVGSSSLNNGSLTVDGNNKLTTAGLTASKVTVGAVTVSGGKVSGLTDAALSAVSTEAVTGKQLNATNTTVSALDTAYKAADTQIRTDFAAADTTLQNNIDAKVAQAAYDTKMSDLDSADTALGSRAAALETAVNDSTTGLAAVNTKVGALDTAYQAADTQIRTDFAAADNALKTELNTAIDEKAKKATDLAGYGITDAYTKNDADAKITAATADMATKTQLTADIGIAKTALESAYQAADTALSDRAAALETAATGMSYDAGKNTTTFTGGVTATVLTAGEFKVGATGFGFGNDGALTAKTVNGIEIKKDESKVMVGGIDLTALSNGDVVTDNTKGIGRNQDTATTTIETNTAISSSGITTNAVTASGTVKASEFVEGSQKLSDKYAAKTALADYTTTTDMNTKFADYATTTAVDTKLADYAKSDSVYSKAAADTAFAKAGDVDTLKTTVGDTDGGLVKDVKDLQSGKADNATQQLLYSAQAKAASGYSPDSYDTLSRSNRYKAAVVPLQRRLKALGYLSGSADGYFGSNTYRAVRNFQSRNGLSVTGVADSGTQQLLYSSSARPASGSSSSGSGSSTGYRLLYWGCRGDAVKRLQQALIDAGYKSYVRSADGIYGQWTYDAVRAYQKDVGLSVDGIAGRNTQNKLYGTKY